MVDLAGDFEAKASEAILDEVEHELVGREGNLVHETIQRAHDILRGYADQFGYDVKPIIDSFVLEEVDRSDGSLTVRWGWDHEAAVFFEFGTSDHTVEGDPLLVFEFDPDEYPGLAEMFPEGTAFLPEADVAGIEETRFARDALNQLRREIS